MLRDAHLFWGVAAFLVAALGVNLLLGQFHPGFEKQPVAHMNTLWNFLGMVLSGLAFTLAGGCPGRQFIMSGEGDGDAGIFVLGMLMGAAFSPRTANPISRYAWCGISTPSATAIIMMMSLSAAVSGYVVSSF